MIVAIMKAVVNHFHLVLLSVLGALLGVLSRARELPVGAGADVAVELGDPSPPLRNLQVARKRSRRRRREKGAARRRDKCQRTRAITLQDAKLGEYCAKQCLACEFIEADRPGLRSKCQAEFCRANNPYTKKAKKSPIILRGCARRNLKRKMREWCEETCQWCEEPRECNENRHTPAECTAIRRKDKTRCENMQCGNFIRDGNLKRQRAPPAREADGPGELDFDFGAAYELDDKSISILGLVGPDDGST